MDSGIASLFRAASQWRLWVTFAWEDLKSTYRRSAFGALWISISFILFIGVKALIFGSIYQQINGSYFNAYLMLGFFSWQYITLSLTSGPNTFTGNENWIRNDPIDLPVFAFQSIARTSFDLVLTGGVVVLGLFVFGYGASWWSLLAIPAILLYVANALWVVLFLGVVCARYRDIGFLIQSLIRVFLFLTPIFWLPSQLPEAVRDILWWNPFAHYLAILRTPILDQTPAIESWIFVGTITVVGWIAALSVFLLFRRRIVFWF